MGRIKNIIHTYKAGPFGSSLITSNLNNIGKYLIYTPEHIAANTTNLESNLYLPDYRINEMGQFEIGKGDIVFPIVGTLGRAMQITSDMPNGIINQRLSKFRLFENIICSNYFMWIFGKSDFYKIYIDMNSRGSFILNLTKLIIGNMPIMLPSLPEQQSIATYLDQKCGEIDELITLQEEMITKLQSYKQSVITEAVTKGLDKNVPLKDSGIEWIGEIPEHWNICKLKNIFLLSTGTTPKDFDQTSEEDNLINWYTPSDILDSCNDLFSSQRKLSEKVIYANKISLFPIGTLLYVGIGASAGKVGYANENGYSNQQITGLIPLNCYSRFYFYYLSALKDKIRDNAFFTTLPIINNAYLGQELIPFPTISEQQSIADYLDQKCSEIDELISIKQQKIEKLKDYKKSLIFECVTGKRKV